MPQKKLPKPVRREGIRTLNVLARNTSRRPFYITDVTKDRDVTHWRAEKAALSYLLMELMDRELLAKLAHDMHGQYSRQPNTGLSALYSCLTHILEEWSKPSAPTVKFYLSTTSPSGVIRTEPPLGQLPHGGIEALTIPQLFALIVQKWTFTVGQLEANPDRLKEAKISPGEFDGGVRTCAFCSRYWGEDCDGCPISAFTGEPHCNDTPYMWWAQTGSPEAARAMLAFVKELEEMYKAQQAGQK